MDKEDILIKIGERFGEVELARAFALDGKSEEDLRAAIREKRITQQAPAPKPPVELNERETKQYSIARAIRSQLAFREGRKADAACFERDIHEQIDKNLDGSIQRQGGILVPTMFRREYLERAGLEVKTAAAGGNAVFTEYGGFLEALRNSTKVLSLGATMLPGLTGDVSFVRQASDSVAYWVGENPGADVAQSDLSLDLVTLRPKTMMARSSFSRQLLNQATVSVDGLVQQSLVYAHAKKLDNSALHADGTANDIKGIYFQTGVNAVAMGGAVTYDKTVDLETAIVAGNADIAEMAYLTTVEVRGKAKKTLEFAVNGASKLWSGSKDGGEMNGYRAEASTNVSKTLGAGNNEHGIVFGVFSAILFGEWGAMELITDPFTLAGQAMIRVISFAMCDLQLKYGPCFSKGTGLTA